MGKGAPFQGQVFDRVKRRGVIPAKTGIQSKADRARRKAWMPACAGMTGSRIQPGGKPATIAVWTKNLPL
jgi:hypothetical protein